MELQELIDTVKPTDDVSWDRVFAYIERDHYGYAVEYWTRFLESIKTDGIKTPVSLRERNGVLHLTNGHHRVWAALKLGIPGVPVRIQKAA